MMRKLIFLGLLAVFISACSQQQAGIGVVPLEGVKVQGKILDATSPSGILLKTDTERTALLPGDWEYRQGGKLLEPTALQPGTKVQAIAPPRESKLVAASDETVVLQSNDDYFSLPLGSLPARAQQIPVQVQTYGGPGSGSGQGQVLPLRDALYNPQYTVLSHPDYYSHHFAQADPYSLSKAYVVGGYQDQALVLSPGPQHVQALLLPPAYPQSQLVSNQPVRFDYLQNDVQVSTWTSLGDGQIDLAKLLLAGTLLQALPGQAIIEVGQNPIAVPWEYVTYRNQPLTNRQILPGSNVGVQYYPGRYDFVSYNDHNVTLLYNQQFVQLPVQYLPKYVYDRPFDLALKNGKKQRRRFRDAQRLVASGQAHFIPPKRVRQRVKDWEKLETVYHRPIPGRPGYHLVGDYQRGYARVERAPKGKSFGRLEAKSPRRDLKRPPYQARDKRIHQSNHAQAQKRPDRRQIVRDSNRPQRQRVQKHQSRRQAQAPRRPQAKKHHNKRQAQARPQNHRVRSQAKAPRASHKAAPQRQRSKGPGERGKGGGKR